jgi:hypothetical protein
MKRYVESGEFATRVEVEWLDSESDSSWMPLAQALAEADVEPLHRSCGYLLASTSDFVLVALNAREAVEGQRAMVADTIRIPRAVVRSVTELTTTRKGEKT